MIYFIKTKTHVKIGYSANPIERLKELQTGNPYKLKLVATIPGDSQTEIGLHNAFQKYRVEGEWFRLTGLLEACIKSFDHPKKRYEITDLKSLQQAGQYFLICDKARRSNKNGKCVKFRKRIRKMKRLGVTNKP